MLYELRIYEVAPGRMGAMVDRFTNVTVGFFRKYGIRATVFLEPVVGTSNQLTYLVEWESLAEREEKWGAFQSDPGWIAARIESEKDGPIVTRITNTILREIPSIMAAVRG